MGAATRRELLIGCGDRRFKRIAPPGHEEWTGLITLDIDRIHKPDVVWDLNKRPLPFEDNYFDEIHAVEVLEHIGRQGDAQSFFAEFSEYWRILKPEGFLIATVPMWNSIWAFSDPSHTRVISSGTLTFLQQPEYSKPPSVRGPMTDYRSIYKADFEPAHVEENGEAFIFALRAVKPSRIQEGR